MGTLDVRPRNAVNAIVGLLLVWAVASLSLPAADLGSIALDPAGARIGPMASLDAIASERPTRSFDIRRNDHPDAIPAVVSAEAHTRAALSWVMRDVHFPASLMAMSPLAVGVGRRGPPLHFGT